MGSVGSMGAPIPPCSKIGVPQNGWFMMENPIQNGWFGGTPIFGNIQINDVFFWGARCMAWKGLLKNISEISFIWLRKIVGFSFLRWFCCHENKYESTQNQTSLCQTNLWFGVPRVISQMLGTSRAGGSTDNQLGWYYDPLPSRKAKNHLSAALVYWRVSLRYQFPNKTVINIRRNVTWWFRESMYQLLDLPTGPPGVSPSVAELHRVFSKAKVLIGVLDVEVSNSNRSKWQTS